MGRLLEAVPLETKLLVTTRWRPEEVRAGVSDLSVLDVLNDRGSSLMLRDDLHAKYYRADQRVFIGSANVTAQALGWADPSNLELLEELPVTTQWIEQFEADLLSAAIEATQEIRDLVLEAVAAFPARAAITSEDRPESHVSIPKWTPALRNPQDLFTYYVSEGSADLPRATLQAAARDLAVLRVPPDLAEESFRAYVAAVLLQMPVVRKVDLYVEVERRFGAIRDLIRRTTDGTLEEANRSWQTLMRWLLYFLPGRYSAEVPRHSELFLRVSALDQRPMSDLGGQGREE